MLKQEPHCWNKPCAGTSTFYWTNPLVIYWSTSAPNESGTATGGHEVWGPYFTDGKNKQPACDEMPTAKLNPELLTLNKVLKHLAYPPNE